VMFRGAAMGLCCFLVMVCGGIVLIFRHCYLLEVDMSREGGAGLFAVPSFESKCQRKHTVELGEAANYIPDGFFASRESGEEPTPIRQLI
jgi:hypothetical protein